MKFAISPRALCLSAVALAIGACLLHVHAQSPAKTPLQNQRRSATQSGVAPPSTIPATRALFEDVASHLPFFDVSTVVFNSKRLLFSPADPKETMRYFTELERALDGRIPAAAVIPLLHHPDAKVRTLALAALFNREEPRLLPQIAALQNDKAMTFPSHGDLSPGWLKYTGIGPPRLEQSVGEITTEMLKSYLQPAGYFLDELNINKAAKFKAYWQTHRNRAFCASWFMMQLARASQSTSPTLPEAKPAIRALRRRIEALPPADRDWTLLYLAEHDGSDVLVSEADLVGAARRRGPDQLLLTLQEKIPSTDPDMQRRDNNDWDYERLMRWILAHATQILRPDMADDLLQCERYQRDYAKRNVSNPFIGAQWAIAASQLAAVQGQTGRARAIVKAAWRRFGNKFDGNERVLLAAQLTALGDPADYNFIATWYFAPPPIQFDGVSSTGKEYDFFGNLPQKGASPATRRLVARLIRDPRFQTTRFWGTYGALGLVKAWTGKELVPINKFFVDARIKGEDDPQGRAATAHARQVLRQSSTQWGH